MTVKQDVFLTFHLIGSFPGAACSLGVNVGDNCKVEDKDAGYVFDLGRIPTSPYFDGKFASVKHGKYNFYLQVSKTAICFMYWTQSTLFNRN